MIQSNPKIYNLLTTNRFTIVDEADEMVSPDWLDAMRKIMGGSGERSLRTDWQNDL